MTTADRGEPIIRRLRDYCQTVVFDRWPINATSPSEFLPLPALARRLGLDEGAIHRIAAV
jgi:hypothetical protein